MQAERQRHAAECIEAGALFLPVERQVVADHAIEPDRQPDFAPPHHFVRGGEGNRRPAGAEQGGKRRFRKEAGAEHGGERLTGGAQRGDHAAAPSGVAGSEPVCCACKVARAHQPFCFEPDENPLDRVDGLRRRLQAKPERDDTDRSIARTRIGPDVMAELRLDVGFIVLGGHIGGPFGYRLTEAAHRNSRANQPSPCFLKLFP